MPDIRITYGIASSSPPPLPPPCTLPYSPCLARYIILAAGSRRQGSRRSQFADMILPATLRAGFLSRSLSFCLLSLLSLSMSVFTLRSRSG